MLLYTSFRPARIGVDSMTTIFRIIFVFFLYLFVIAGLFVAEAHEFKVGTLDLGHPWSRPTPKDANIAGGYLTITNKGKVADRLIGGASPAAGQIEVHEMANVDGMMKTRALANGLEIKPGKTIELKPGAYRILLLGLKEPFQLGQKVKGTLVFEKAGPVEIVYNIEENPEASNAPASGGALLHKHH
jgi:periplasmic copper chaperone A